VLFVPHRSAHDAIFLRVFASGWSVTTEMSEKFFVRLVDTERHMNTGVFEKVPTIARGT
jgi:hypothetical protein